MVTVCICFFYLSVNYLPSLCGICAGYRHVYLEGMEEASVFVHVAVNDVTGKVGKVEPTEELTLISSVAYRQNVTCGYKSAACRGLRCGILCCG